MKNPCQLMKSNGKKVISLEGALSYWGFRLKQRIGQGRFGTCYEISGNSGNYVLKLYHANDVKRRKEKLVWEGKWLKMVDHPAIPEVIADFDQDGFYGLILEKMTGNDLEALIDSDHEFKKEEIIAILTQLIEIVDYLYGLKISHRDLKVSNILWTGSKLALIDFGSARFIPQFNKRFNPDFWGIGDVFMRLSAMCHEIMPSSDDFLIDQLRLNDNEKIVLKRMLYIETPYQNINELKHDFNAAFLNNNLI